MSDTSDVTPGSAWVNSDSESLVSASARSTAPSYMPTGVSASARYYSFRSALANGAGSQHSAALAPVTTSGTVSVPRTGLVVAAGDVDAQADGGRGEERRLREGVAVLERHADFMRFFFEHLTGCPPHGPFRHYAALTLVQRARRRYGMEHGVPTDAVGADGSASAHPPSTLTNELSPAADGPASGVREHTSTAMAGYCVDVGALREALTITNVLALMDACFDTRHLKGWELLYVPAEVRGVDVEALLEAQRQRRLRGVGK